MDAEAKTKWVAALRSGEYKQGQNLLHRTQPDGCVLCCLGVLAEIQKVPRILGSWNYGDVSGTHRYEYKFAENSFSATGIPEGFCGINYDESSVLVSMNDHGNSFEDIADYIEANM